MYIICIKKQLVNNKKYLILLIFFLCLFVWNSKDGDTKVDTNFLTYLHTEHSKIQHSISLYSREKNRNFISIISAFLNIYPG